MVVSGLNPAACVFVSGHLCLGDRFGTGQATQNSSQWSVEPRLTEMSAPEQHKYKILVVSDDLDENTTMVVLLEFDGHEVRTVDTGEAALAMLETTGFDLIITEYGLPSMKGDEFAALVKEQWPNQRIIMATAHFEGSNVEDASSVVGVDCLLSKPFTMQQLREAMIWVFEGAVETRLNVSDLPALPPTDIVDPHKTRSRSEDSGS